MKLLEALNWRYATKQMTGEKLDQADVDLILEAARLAPTSAGLQPYHIISISNQALKEQISPVALNQPQITQSSHLLVFTAWDSIPDERIDERYNSMNTERNLPLDTTMDVVQNLKNLFAGFTEEQQYHHTAKQAHIGFGVAIAAAAELGIDATPMEGFDKEGLDELLGLKEKGLKSVVLLALGRRNPEKDWLLGLKKFRISRDEFVTDIH
ncbi:NAD(P)H-dependent oxidoreductase [Acinetobacter cumulans]|uniref:NAD(P)H-dependent oxidoreductase n=1 Tax=Acinetobacter cumulans TaxID=2136182 RepID=A0ABX9U9Y8_9GAMM|nr:MULTISPECIES: NAD(P)H-dependent oxidoreductase [Acinetobacter]RFS30990.1 NAD(P)H-dependent oxidoreductase [Acinetobacter sp. SWAC5]RLL49830.1 NAD(P)H-dependent oxidoreductase [Acinetobacter cumulans]